MRITQYKEEKMAILLMILVFLLFLFAAPSGGCQVHDLKNFLLPAFKDKSVSDFLLSTLPGIEKLWMCTVKCRFDTRCRSYQFNDLTKTCSLFACGFSQPDNTLLQTTEETGCQLYGMVGRDQSFGNVCTTSDECNYTNSYCRDGRCECVLGFNYDPHTGRCVSHCVSYGDAFQTQPNSGLYGYNKEILNAMTPEGCMQACLDRVSFVCRSIDFYPRDGQCQLSEAAWMDAPPQSQNLNSEWTMFTRHCAVQ